MMNRRFYRFMAVLALFLAASSRALAQATITSQPQSVLNLIIGYNANFSVAAQSAVTANLHYQWLRNGVRIPGATNSTLSFTDVQATDCGAFSVIVNDTVADTVSEPAELTVSLAVLLGGTLSNPLPLINSPVRSANFTNTKGAGVPDIIPGDPGGSPVWFTWTPPLQQSGIVTFSTLGSDFDTIMGAYTGSAPTNLQPVPSAYNDDDGAGYLCSEVTFDAVAGTSYLIAVDGYFGAQGNLVVSWALSVTSDSLPPVSPNVAALTVAEGASVTLPSPWVGNDCDWFLNGEEVETQTPALAVINTSDATVGAYTARFTSERGFMGFSEPSRLEINVLQDGTTASNSTASPKFLGAARSPFVQPTQPASVGKLDGGGDTRGYIDSQVFSTEGDPNEPGEPAVCGQQGSSPAWYVYVTPASGSLLIDTAGSSFNTMLGVFIGPGNSFSTLTNIGCGYTTNYTLDGQPSVYSANVPANQTNYIVVEGYNGSSGTAHLNINLGAPVNIATPPQSQSAGPGSNVTLAVSATGGTPLSYFWQFNGTDLPGATNGTLTISNLQASTAGTYTVIISNLVSVMETQAVVSLAIAPSITVPPASQTVASNSTASLSVTASGTPAPVFQWLFDGSAIGVNSSTLSIPGFQSANQGSYSVVVSNFIGAVTSSPAVLLLNGPYRVDSFALSNGAFQIELAGVAGSNFVLQASSDLINWVSLVTNNAPNGFVDYSDTNAGAFTNRFYRGLSK